MNLDRCNLEDPKTLSSVAQFHMALRIIEVPYRVGESRYLPAFIEPLGNCFQLKVCYVKKFEAGWANARQLPVPLKQHYRKFEVEVANRTAEHVALVIRKMSEANQQNFQQGFPPYFELFFRRKDGREGKVVVVWRQVQA